MCRAYCSILATLLHYGTLEARLEDTLLSARLCARMLRISFTAWLNTMSRSLGSLTVTPLGSSSSCSHAAHGTRRSLKDCWPPGSSASRPRAIHGARRANVNECWISLLTRLRRALTLHAQRLTGVSTRNSSRLLRAPALEMALNAGWRAWYQAQGHSPLMLCILCP